MAAPDVKPVVFVLMPTAPEFDDVYTRGIQAACDDAGVTCERVDERLFDESLLARIYSRINSADLIVSDMSGRNPIVFYETGFAHAMGKVVIMLTRDAADIPFDLQHYPHIVYGDHMTDLRSHLTRRVRWFLDQPVHAGSS